jgi:hypothetical protein
MFVQFIEGRVQDPAALREQLDAWREEVTGADGWLGTTAGVTDDGTAFVAARFASAEEARANSDRPEQSAWWAATEALFDGEARFEDHEEVATIRAGGSDDAGFVQVIRGWVNDADAARRMFEEGLPDDARPDVIGGVAAFRPDGTYTTVIYFTSEERARAGERDDAETGDDFAEQMDALHDDPPRFLDLTDPWLWSP